MKMPDRRKGQRGVDSEATVLRAFSVDHAARITQLSKSRLTRWDRLGFFSPEHADESDRGNPYSRVYSFTDLVGLRTLAVLTMKHRITIAELKRAYAKLAERVERPWVDTPLSVLNRKVVFDLDGVPRDTDGQYAGQHISLPTIASEVATMAEALRKRNNDQIGVTERHKFIAHNALVMAGTRIPVTAIESFVRAGHSDKAIVDEYPSLTKFDVSTIRNRMKVAA
jgi:uncharacterized protein (DUF433 family)